VCFYFTFTKYSFVSTSVYNLVYRMRRAPLLYRSRYLTTLSNLRQPPSTSHTQSHTQSTTIRQFHVITPSDSSGRKKLKKLSDPVFWDEVYEKEGAPEWYMGSKTAAEFIAGIIRGKGLLGESSGLSEKSGGLSEQNSGLSEKSSGLSNESGGLIKTHIIELGCGTSPIIPALLTELGLDNVRGYCTDISHVCIEHLTRSHQSDTKIQFHHLDVSNLSTFISLHTKSSNVEDERSSNVIIIDKGLLDALIWDGRDLSTLATAPWNSLLSISGEDPDIRVTFLQEVFRGCDVSVACLGDEDTFCYSVVRQ